MESYFRFQKSPDLIESNQWESEEILIIIESNIGPVSSPFVWIEHLYRWFNVFNNELKLKCLFSSIEIQNKKHFLTRETPPRQPNPE